MIKLMVKINIFISIFGILLFVIPSNTWANPGGHNGRVYMNFEGREYNFKDIIIHRSANCAKQKDEGDYHGTDTCIDKSCLGQFFCPQIANLYYTTDRGEYTMSEGYATYMNRVTGEKYTNCPTNLGTWQKGAALSACGMNCGENPYSIKARFPDNYNLDNFPAGINFRKGKWKVHMSPDIAKLKNARILTDDQGEYFLGEFDNSVDTDGLQFEWMPDPFPIAGQIKDNKTGQGILGVTILIQNGNTEVKEIKTDQNGKYLVESKGFLIEPHLLYAVRINTDNLPKGYLKPPKTTAENWAFIANDKVREDLSKTLGREVKDVPKGSESYEFQQSGNSDCAGLAKDGSNKIGRCDFVLDQDPNNPPVQPPSSPPGSTDMCSITPINSFSINNKNSTDSIIVPVWLPGESTTDPRTIPVAVNFGGTCSVKYIKFNYISTATPPSSPDPILCARSTNRPDGCACTLDNQCQGQKCDQNRLVCFTEAFIRTEGGDVHSNVKIEQ